MYLHGLGSPVNVKRKEINLLTIIAHGISHFKGVPRDNIYPKSSITAFLECFVIKVLNSRAVPKAAFIV